VKPKPKTHTKPSDTYLECSQRFWTRFEAHCGERSPTDKQLPWMLLLAAAAPYIPVSLYGRIERHLLELLGEGGK